MTPSVISPERIGIQVAVQCHTLIEQQLVALMPPFPSQSIRRVQVQVLVEPAQKVDARLASRRSVRTGLRAREAFASEPSVIEGRQGSGTPSR
jgi:hypothetical protein